MNKSTKNNALFKKAEESIATAKRAMVGKKALTWVACYHAQLAVDQFLRMFLASSGVTVTDTSLIGLNRACAAVVSEFTRFDSVCDFLTFGGVDIRYPVETTLSKRDAVKAIKAAEKIMNLKSAGFL